jgi:hypothetical protein
MARSGTIVWLGWALFAQACELGYSAPDDPEPEVDAPDGAVTGRVDPNDREKEPTLLPDGGVAVQRGVAVQGPVLANTEMPPYAHTPAGKAWVAACPTGCEPAGSPASGCVRPGSVFTYDEDSAVEFFRADAQAAGSVCSANLSLGGHVTMQAVPEPGWEFARWEPGKFVSQGLPCPCAGSRDPVCTFEVRQNVYCGAIFGGAQ